MLSFVFVNLLSRATNLALTMRPEKFILISNFLDTFHINPQLHLILSEMEEVIVSLNQHSIMEPKVYYIRNIAI